MAALPNARIIRIVWLITFVVPLVLAVLLLGVKSAHALPNATVAAPAELEEEFEFEDEEFEEEACEVAEEEFEEGELSAAETERVCEEAEGKKSAAGSDSAPEECLLRSAHARLVAHYSHNDVRLTIGYTTYEPTAATVDFGAKGGKGSLHLGTARRHLGRSGVIRLTKALSDPEMEKVDAAGSFTVRIHVADAPGSCRRFETEQLTVEHDSQRQAVWSQPH